MLLIAASAAVLCAGSAHVGTIKVGVIGPFSGPFAIAGKKTSSGAWRHIG
jgi:ABC-type branched-subunit amino acid transport system substrate-binding protein